MKIKSYLTAVLCLSALLTACGAESEDTQQTIEIQEIKTQSNADAQIDTNPPAPEEVVISCMPVVEANTTLRLSEFVTYSNVTMKDPYKEIDTSRLGTFEMIVSYYYGEETRDQVISYEVRDTTPPVILDDGSHSYVPTGEEFDLSQLIGYGDNFNTRLSLTYDGDVNTEVPGKYMVTAYLTDTSGNQTTGHINVTVGDSAPYSYDEPVTFKEFKNKYSSKANTYVGVDISSWQAEVDFNALKKAGCDFVIIRIGRGLGEPTIDDYFEENLAAAKKAGLKVGVYFYTIDAYESQIRADADWIAQQLKGQKLDFPIGFDWEDFEDFQTYGINFHELNQLYHAFVDQMKTNGYDTMLYSTRFALDKVWENPGKEKIWLADYTEQTDYPDYYMWRRCETGIVDGIAGNANFNVYTERNPVTEEDDDPDDEAWLEDGNYVFVDIDDQNQENDDNDADIPADDENMDEDIDNNEFSGG